MYYISTYIYYFKKWSPFHWACTSHLKQGHGMGNNSCFFSLMQNLWCIRDPQHQFNDKSPFTPCALISNQKIVQKIPAYILNQMTLNIRRSAGLHVKYSNVSTIYC